MDMTLPRNTSLLEKWLEDMPNSNNSVNVKKERNDFRDIFASNPTTSSAHKNPIPNNSVTSGPNVANNGTTRSQTTSSMVNSTQSKVCFKSEISIIFCVSCLHVFNYYVSLYCRQTQKRATISRRQWTLRVLKASLDGRQSMIYHFRSFFVKTNVSLPSESLKQRFE